MGYCFRLAMCLLRIASDLSFAKYGLCTDHILAVASADFFVLLARCMTGKHHITSHHCSLGLRPCVLGLAVIWGHFCFDRWPLPRCTLALALPFLKILTHNGSLCPTW